MPTQLNGTQLYGWRRWIATLRMGRCKGLKGLTLKQKLALNYVSRQSKMTRLDGRIYTNTFTPYFPSTAYDRFLEGVVAVASGKPLPVVTNFAVTARCPCNCWHCSFAKRSPKDRLSIDILRQAIADVQQLGTSVVGLTGGEPLLRNDLEEIIAAIGPQSMPLLFTTGYGLTPERVRLLKAAGLGIPVISLDHHEPEIHDRGRGRAGMHRQAVDAVRMFKEVGFYVAVSFVPDRKLVADREALFKTLDFFRELGINDMRLTSPILSGHLTGKPESLLTPEQVQTVWDVQKMCTDTPGYPGVFAYDVLESDAYYGCGAGYNYLFVDAEGNLSPCDFTMLSLGNLTERPLTQIWAEMSGKFNRPGCGCYANKISGTIARMGIDRFPLEKAVSEGLVARHPSSDPDRIPAFYKRMGMKRQKP